MDREKLKYHFGKAVFIQKQRMKHAWEDAQSAWALYRIKGSFPETSYKRVTGLIESVDVEYYKLPQEKQSMLERALDFIRTDMPDQGYFAFLEAMAECCDLAMDRLKEESEDAKTPRDPEITSFKERLLSVRRALGHENPEVREFIDRFVPFPATGGRDFPETYLGKKVSKIKQREQAAQQPQAPER